MLVSQFSDLQVKLFCCQPLTSRGYMWFEQTMSAFTSCSGSKELNMTVPVCAYFFKSVLI